MSIEAASNFTRIKEPFLKAIEEDRYELCPSPFYVKGFLANYARYLGLDPRDVVLRYQEFIKPPPPSQEVARQELPKETIPPPKRIASRVLFISVLLLTLLVPLFIYYYIFHQLRAPSLPPLSNNKPEPIEVVQEKENSPVIHQIKQMEIIGPKEVQAEPFYKVLEAHIGTGIEMESGRPMVVGKGSEFKCDNQRVYFFTRIMTQREGKIAHVWRWEGEEFHRIEMQVKPPAWAVYSYITLPPARTGHWRAEVWDGEQVLTSLDFKAQQPNASSPPVKQ